MIECLTADLPARHGFFTRKGGVSTGPYASLNCGFSGADPRENILQNRAIVAKTLGLDPADLLGLKQVHGISVITVTAAWPIGQGPDGDAMVTTIPGIGLGVIAADCAPVLFADQNRIVIGAAHAGWRGALAGVLEATAAAMRALGAGPISAAIGPCIHQDSYQVRADLRDAVLAHDPADSVFLADSADAGHWQFDLPGYCAARLQKIGVATAILPHDTCADEENFFSHRRRTLRGEAAIGHHIAVIRL
jgi:YfiH family protein